MPENPVLAIARIPLARSRLRVLTAPVVLLATGAVSAGGGLVIGGWPGIGLMALGGLVAVIALYLGLVVSTVRLDLEVSTLRLRWLGTDRRYALVRGAVTRVPLVGAGAVRLRPRLGAFGWGLGPARLRGDETIQLVRLARSASVILIPTDAGRVAVAPRSEEQLIESLSAAARVQQRLDQVAARARAVPLERVVETAPAPPRPTVPEPERVLTGIERVLLEERLAAERAAALAAAEAERARAQLAAREAEATAPHPAEPEADAVLAPRRGLVRPGWLRRPAPRIAFPAVGGMPRARLLGYLVAGLPVVAASAVWGYAALSGRLDLSRPDLEAASLALALAGPIGALGALAGRAWFPKLVGLVTVASLCSLVLVARALVA